MKVFIRISKFIKTLFFELIMSHSLLVICFITILSVLIMGWTRDILINRLVETNINTLIQVEQNITSVREKVSFVASILTLDEDMVDVLAYTSQDEVELEYKKKTIEEQMKLMAFTFGEIDLNLFLLGADNTLYMNSALYDFDYLIENNDLDFQLTNSRKEIIWNNCIIGMNEYGYDQYMLTGTTPVFSLYSSKRLGYLILGIEEKSIFDIYSDILGEEIEVFIVDSKGQVISSSQRDSINAKVDLNGYIDDLSKKNGYKYKTIDNDEYLCIYNKIENSDWYIVQTLPEKALVKDVSKLNNKIIIVSSLSIILAILMSFFISRKITNPIVELNKKVNDIRQNTKPNAINDDYSMGTYRGKLSRESYEEVISNLSDAIDLLVEEQRSKREIELKALQMQINPHFLYNTLNSIKCLVWTNRIEDIEPAINALGNLLSNTIGRGSEMITLEEEISLLDSYVYIQKMRLDIDISFQYYVDDEIKECKTPRLILQPIVENSIVHGIEPRGTNGVIKVYCNSCYDKIIIEIIDNGIGVNIDDHQESIGKERTFFKGIGLDNVDKRLKLIFGEEYGVTFNSVKNVGTSVTITIPQVK